MLERHPLPHEHWDLELRRAQNLASLARALQAAIVDYHSDQLQRAAKHDDDLPF
jgi:hypothetical protein